MSTPYNDQWVLERPPQPPHERDGSREAHPPHTLRERGRSAREMPRSTLRRPARKRPRWIDRDT
jgi:hypothetical protein